MTEGHATLELAQATLELAADAGATLGEGPVWDPARGVLWWVDIVEGIVHRFEPRTGADGTLDVGSAVGAVALRGDGSLLAAVAGGLATLDPEGRRGPELLLPLGTTGDGLRCNDGKCDPAGRFWVGRMRLDLAPGAGSLLRVDADLAVTRRLAGLTIPNGLGWSPDGRTMYFTDSTWGEVRAHDYDASTGSMGESRPLVHLPRDGSVPDGLTVDAEGCLWVAIWGGGRVLRAAPDGTIVGQVALPVSRVTSCTFGGDDLADLYITTARGDADPAGEPLAGALFRCRPGVRGLPSVPFAG